MDDPVNSGPFLPAGANAGANGIHLFYQSTILIGGCFLSTRNHGPG